MANENAIELLKSLLEREVERFCRRLDPLWHEVSNVVDVIQRNKWQAVFFGGTLRSLLMSRLIKGQAGRPRDVDIVIQGPPLEILRKLFGNLISRETRFGGFHLNNPEWEFDVWPLEKTWGIVQDKIIHPDFDHLPNTTFLNIEAAAIDIWPDKDGKRRIYSGNDQFFQAIIDRVVEINRIENPFPDLCVIRSLVLAKELDFKIGPHLHQYIANHGPRISETDLEMVQRKHYGKIRVPTPTLKQWITEIVASTDEFGMWFNSGTSAIRPRLAPDYLPYDFLRTVARWNRSRKHPV